MAEPTQNGGQAARMIRDHIRKGTFRELLQDWKWILGFSRGYRGMILLYTLLGLVSTGLSLVGSIIGKMLIDLIVVEDLHSLQVDVLIQLVPWLLFCAGAGVGLSALNSHFSTKLGVTMHNHVHSSVFDKLIHAQWLGLSRYSTGDLLNRFSADVGTVASCAVTMLPSVIIQLFTILATLAVITYYDPVMALIGCASTPLLFALSHHLIKRQRQHNMAMREASSDMSAFQSETFRNIDTLKSFGIEDQVTGQLHQCQNRYRDVVMAHNRFSIQTHALLSIMSTLVQYLALGYCLWQLWHRNLLIGTMVLFLQQRSTLQNAFSALINMVPKALSGSVAAERLRELTELPPEEQTAPPVVSARCTLRLEHAEVGYQPDVPVLQDVTLHAAPGEVIALIGPSGQGKTTLLRMFLGLLSPTRGCALLESPDHPPVSLSPATRHLFSYVPQGNTLLAGTVAENLRMVASDASQEQIIRALKNACAWEFVKKLPEGIHTPLGEGGRGVSEGQAQRLAIARALMREAPILLLDEVTSALDMATEEAVLRNLSGLGLTCVVTTHRPSVLRLCARVYRVEDGRVSLLTEQEVRHLTRSIQ